MTEQSRSIKRRLEIQHKCAKRIPVVLDIIKKIWEKHPNISLMQLLCSANFPESDKYFTQDDELIINLRRLYDE